MEKVDKTMQGLLVDIAEAGLVVHRIKSSRKGSWRVPVCPVTVRKDETMQRAAAGGFVKIDGDTARLTNAGLEAVLGRKIDAEEIYLLNAGVVIELPIGKNGRVRLRGKL